MAKPKIGLHQLSLHLKCPTCGHVPNKKIGFDIPIECYLHVRSNGCESIDHAGLYVDPDQTRPVMCMACGMQFLLQECCTIPLDTLAASYQPAANPLPPRLKVDRA